MHGAQNKKPYLSATEDHTSPRCQNIAQPNTFCSLAPRGTNAMHATRANLPCLAASATDQAFFPPGHRLEIEVFTDCVADDAVEAMLPKSSLR